MAACTANFWWIRVTFGGAPHDAFTSRRTQDEICKTDYLGDSVGGQDGMDLFLRSASELREHHVFLSLSLPSTLSLDYSLKRPLYIQPAGGRSLMGKRSVIKLLITNSRGKNSQKLTRAFSVRYCRMYRMCARINKIFTVAENCRALRLIILSAFSPLHSN